MFFLSVISAVIILVFSVLNKVTFFQELENISNAKGSSINYQNIQIIIRELVNVANKDESNTLQSIQGPLSDFMKDLLYK